MKFVKKACAVIFAITMLSGCGFQDIESDSEVLKTDVQSGTLPVQTLEPPQTTTPAVDDIQDPENPDNQKPDTDVPSDEPVEAVPVVMVATTNVNARKGPSTADEIALTVVEGTEVTVLGLSQGWYKVDIDGEELYIIQDYLEEVKAEEAPEAEENAEAEQSDDTATEE